MRKIVISAAVLASLALPAAVISHAGPSARPSEHGPVVSSERTASSAVCIKYHRLVWQDGQWVKVTTLVCRP